MGRPLIPTSKRWLRLRAKVIARDKSCFVCRTTKRLTVHHIKPRKHGGKTVERNLITMCESCHNHVEYYDMDWPAIINLRKQKAYGFFDDFDVPDDAHCKIGKDKFGIFIIRGAKQNSPVIYDGVWPMPAPKVKQEPVYVSADAAVHRWGVL